jgi:hypothetical protein
MSIRQLHPTPEFGALKEQNWGWALRGKFFEILNSKIQCDFVEDLLMSFKTFTAMGTTETTITPRTM